jgi:(1->4)-alpha-D-glucan 1-alpha-D-glucosylmutase
LVEDIARPGLWTALARTLVHLTSPGVPDLYQGDELWTFALTDPDNRSPVDFARRRAALDAQADARTLVAHPEDGRVKLHVVRTALALRRAHSAAFAAGYEPLEVRGAASRHAFAFARRGGGRVVVTIVPRLVRSLVQKGEPPVGATVWGDTAVALASGRFTNVLTGEAVTATNGSLAVAEACASFPAALLVG